MMVLGQTSLQIGEKGGDEATVILHDATDYVCIGGIFQQTLEGKAAHGNSDLFIQQYDTLQGLVRQYTFGSTQEDALASIELWQDSLYAVYGKGSGPMYCGEDTILNGQGNIAFLALLDKQLQLVRVTTLRSSGLLQATAMKVDVEGNCYLTGSFSDTLFVGGSQLVHPVNTAFFLIKVKSDGQIAWAKSTMQSDGSIGKTIAVGKDKVYLAGQFLGYLYLGVDTFLSNWIDPDIFWSVYDTAGGLMRYRQYGGAYASEVEEMVLLQDKLFMAGHFMGSLKIDTIELATAERRFDGFLVQLDTNGSAGWATQSLSLSDCFVESLDVNDSLIVIGGYFRDDFTWMGQSLFAVGGFDGFVIQLNHAATLSQVKIMVGQGNDLVKACKIDPNNKVDVVGAFQQDITVNLSTLNANGFSDGFWWRYALMPLLDDTKKIELPVVSVFPNPTSGWLQVQTEYEVQKCCLYDTKGRLVLQSHQQLLNLERLSRGVYLLQVQTLKGNVLKKVIKY